MSIEPGRVIVLGMLEMAYKNTQKPFPSNFQNYLQEYRARINNYFNEHIINALEVFMAQVHIGSPCLSTPIGSYREHLERIKTSHAKVLEFFGHYAMKHTFGSDRRKHNSGIEYYIAVSDFLNEMVGRGMLKDYIRKLNNAAKLILVRAFDNKAAGLNKPITNPYFSYFTVYEEKFSQDVLNYLLTLFDMDDHKKLNVTNENFEIPNYFTSNIETALSHAKSHHDSMSRSILRGYGHDPIYSYFQKACFNFENNQNILHFAISIFRKCLNATPNAEEEYPLIMAHNYFVLVLKHAKSRGWYITLLEMDIAAKKMNEIYTATDSEMVLMIEESILRDIQDKIEKEQIDKIENGSKSLLGNQVAEGKSSMDLLSESLSLAIEKERGSPESVERNQPASDERNQPASDERTPLLEDSADKDSCKCC